MDIVTGDTIVLKGEHHIIETVGDDSMTLTDGGMIRYDELSDDFAVIFTGGR